MAKILRNITGSNIVISDAGETLYPSVSFTIHPTQYAAWASSSQIITNIGNGSVIVNDGTNDLTIADGVDLIRGLFPNIVGIAAGTDRTAIGRTGDRLKVDTNYEKFYELIGASKWMNLANYDEIVPTFSNGDSDLTLTYKEDGVILGTAIITNYASSLSWSMKLNRYINEDDGTLLQDDDGSLLNLD